MKKAFFALIPIICIVMGCAGGAKSAGSGGKTLDQAIAEATAEIEESIPKGSKIAILNFNSTSDKFSEYVIDELTANLVKNKILTIVDRKEIDLIREEFKFQLSGDVSDDSAQELGRMLGAQAIVSGSLSDIGGSYRIVIRALNVQTATVEVQYRSDIANDSRVQALLAGGRSGGTATAGGTGGGGQAAQAQTARPKNGTYTFFPRPQATKAGVGVDAYLVKITVQGNYMVIYLTNVPRGLGGRANPGYWYLSNDLLTNLDRPSQTYKKMSHKDNPDGNQTGEALSYENVTASRFSLELSWSGQIIFSEINLADAEYEP